MKMLQRLVVLLTVWVTYSDAFTSPSTPTLKKGSSRLSVAATTSEAASRIKRVNSLKDWAKSVEIQTKLDVFTAGSGGLGLKAASGNTIKSNDLLITVPSNVALSVESGSGPDAATMELVTERKILRKAPWFVQLSVYLHRLRKVQNDGKKAWLEMLPAQFDTPIHWSSLDELQYSPLDESVKLQTKDWKKLYNDIMAVATPQLQSMSFVDFVWGCEIARSRAFSGAYAGSAFNPAVYAFTLLLVAGYVGAGLGTLEQAANGAGLVLCASILRDFVLPKLFATQRHVICPLIDMANHDSSQVSGEVSFEFFGDAYSLAATKDISLEGSQVYISYGARSNDQLLQYYGFVEKDNPHDVYVMPPLREWNIDELEKTSGRTFATGRLEKLNRAGLLGRDASSDNYDDSGDYSIANPKGGAVITRSSGLDPAVVQAIRALVSTEEEWNDAGQGVGNFCDPVNSSNEDVATIVAKKAMQMELDSKPTSLEADQALLGKMQNSKSIDVAPEDVLAVMFRIEKKKLLKEVIGQL